MDVLLVEDNPGDVALARNAFRSLTRPLTLHVANDGAEAMAFLRKVGIYSFAARPHLIFLDLNLPKMNGRELLTKIKTDSILNAIPTIVLSVSNDPDDIEYCYQNGANAYLVKPPNLDEFNRLAEVVNHLWFSLTSFPGEIAGSRLQAAG